MLDVNALHRLLSPLVLLVLVLCPAAQDEGDAPDPCKECRGVGLVPCPEHRGASRGQGIDPERHALYCNAARDCDTCRGAEWLDCEACADADSEAWLARRGEALVESGKRAAKYDKFMERTLHLAESEHFVLVCELKARKAGRTKADTHQLLHIFLARLEDLFADYCEVLGAKESDFAKKSVVFLWQEREDHDKAGMEYCEWEWDEPYLYQRGPVNKFTLHAGDKRYKDDAVLHRTLVHHVVHGLMNLQKPAMWTGKSPGGWADAGVPHWFEDKYFGVCDTFCSNQVQGPVPSAKKWRAAARKLVAGGRILPLEEFEMLRNEQLTGEQHALGFSLVDYLLAREPGKLNLVLKRLRARTPLRDSIKEVYGLKVEELEAEWKEWVLTTYAKR